VRTVGGDEKIETEKSEKTEDATPEDKKPEKKPSGRAQEWADLKKKEQILAQREREAKRQADENVKTRAELQKIQQELVELNKLRTENPKEFLKRVGGGDMRALLKSAIEEPEQTAEQKELKELRDELKALKADRDAEKSERETEKQRADRERAEQADREFHQRNFGIVRDAIDKVEGLERLKKQSPRTKALVAEHAYREILGVFRSKGYEPDIATVLASLEDELFPAEQQAPATGPSEQATEPIEPAKPGAKRAPVLKAAGATSRASGTKPQTFDEKVKAAASRLKRRA